MTEGDALAALQRYVDETDRLRDRIDAEIVKRLDAEQQHAHELTQEIIKRIDEREKTFAEQVAEAKAAQNEWRGALQDRERNTVSRIEYEGKTSSIEAKGEAANSTTAALTAALAVEVRAGFLGIQREIEGLRISRAEELKEKEAGRRTINDVRVWVLGAAAFMGSVIGIVGWATGR